MKVRIDPAKCQGHARCYALCPEVFHLDKDGYSFVDDKPIPAELEEQVWMAEGNCPEHAIAIEENKGA